MSRARRQAGSVRGPASALTSFLAGLGVEPSAPLTWGNNQNPDGPLAADGPVLTDGSHLDPAGAVTARTVEAGPSEVPQKRSRSASIDSDDLDLPTNKTSSSELKAVGEFMNCGECEKQFTVTTYTKPRPKGGFLCVQCCYALGIDPFAKPKKAAPKKPAPKETRKQIQHYDSKKGTPLLGDICINIIGKYIEDVDQLGDIGNINMDKVCKIISKSRLLTPETASLFYSVDRKELRLYDCTLLSPEAYLALGNLCPSLETLRLHLVGQMTAESLVHLSRLPLRRLELFGPFLVRETGWKTLFETCDLVELQVFQSPRIDRSTIQHLADHCSSLSHLSLMEIGKLDDSFLPHIARLPLTKLEISAPGNGLTDEAVTSLLAALPNLESLGLSDHADLTDATLAAIANHCTHLQRLKLSHMPELTDAGVAGLFKKRKNLVHVDMEKGHDLADAALKALVHGSSSTLESLSIMGWRETSKEALKVLPRCSELKYINLGWCRQVTDFLLKDLLDSCPNMERMDVWGCNQLSDAAPRKRGVQIVGIETHSI